MFSRIFSVYSTRVLFLIRWTTSNRSFSKLLHCLTPVVGDIARDLRLRVPRMSMGRCRIMQTLHGYTNRNLYSLLCKRIRSNPRGCWESDRASIRDIVVRKLIDHFTCTSVFVQLQLNIDDISKEVLWKELNYKLG